MALPKDDRDEVIEFLKSLQILPERAPALVMQEKDSTVDREGAR